MVNNKKADFTGKSLIIALGIVATMGSFTDMFNIDVSEIIIAIFTVCISFFIMSIIKGEDRYKKTAGIFGTVVMAALINWNSVKAGVYYIANDIIDVYSEYSGRESENFAIYFDTPEFFRTMTGSITFFVCLIIVVYAYILAVASVYKMFSSIHILLSLGILLTGLMLGKFPGVLWTVLLVFYYVMCIMYDKNRHIYLLRAVTVSGIAIVFTLLTFMLVNPEDYNNEKYMNYRNKLEDFAQKFNMDLFDGDSLADGKSTHMAHGGINGGHLGQVDEIKNSGLEMLRIEMQSRVLNDIYLKGFVANEYKGDRWEELDSDNLIKMYELINDMGRINSLVADYSHIGLYYENKIKQIEIKYIVDKKNYRYMPYYVNEDYKNNFGELRLENEKNQDSDIFTFFDVSLEEVLGIINDDSNSRKELDGFYEISGEVTEEVEKVLKKIMKDAPIYDGSEESLLECILYVEKYLSENAQYTLSPGALKKGNDFIVDFLTVKKKGYCTSFASAGVMMFRYMGIPARYVEGYLVSYSDVVESEDGSLHISVTDDEAHAWPEIYVKGIGFVPIEVTPGYNLNLADNILDVIEGDKENTTEITQETDNTVGNSISAENRNNAEQEEGNENQETTIKNGKIETDLKTDKENDRNVWIIFGISVLVILLLIISVKLYKICYDKKRKKAFDYNTDDLRKNIEILTILFNDILKKAEIDVSKNRSTSEICKDINIYIDKIETVNKEKECRYTLSGGKIPDKADTLEIINIIFKAKYSDKNAKFSEKEADKLRQYVEEFKNSLQYFKNRV